MKYLLPWIAAGCGIAAIALAQDIKTPADAFSAGQTFANGTKGKDAAAGSLNATAAAGNVPKYSTDPQEKSIFGAGKTLIAPAGTKKQNDCVGYKAGNAYDQQECDAVNYLTKMPGERPKFDIDKTKDPILVGSKTTVANPGTVPGSGTSSCKVVTTNVPGTYTYETCTQTQTFQDIPCDKVLTVNATASCTPGSSYYANAADNSGLGKDACDGGDTIFLTYQCSQTRPPSLRVETNQKYGGNFGFNVSAWSFDETHNFSNCRGRWKGTTTCDGPNCTSNVTMEIYLGSSFCTAYDENGNSFSCYDIGPVGLPVCGETKKSCYETVDSYSLSGTLTKSFSYTTLDIQTTDTWASSCDALEARVAQ
ncbi:MAG: hypothetical protein ACK5TK_03375 [Betaproteobacteria bacterium]